MLRRVVCPASSTGSAQRTPSPVTAQFQDAARCTAVRPVTCCGAASTVTPGGSWTWATTLVTGAEPAFVTSTTTG
jgi:hypothetical protein